MVKVRMIAAALAAVAISTLPFIAAPATAATASQSLNCGLGGTQTETVTGTAPATVAQGSNYTVDLDVAQAVANGGDITNLVWYFQTPTGTSIVPDSVTTVGTGSGTLGTVSTAIAGSVVQLKVSGKISNGASFKPPILRFQLQATGAVGTALPVTVQVSKAYSLTALGTISINCTPNNPIQTFASTTIVAAATAPAQPAAPTATAGDGQADVSWSAPADGGSPITGYTVTPYIGAVAQTPQVFDASTTTRTITGLANGTAYTFTVAATNAVGTGTASAQSSPAVTPAGLPAAPTIGTATAGNASADVTWTAGADNGSAITGYSVTPYDGVTPLAPQDFDGAATSGHLTGLTNGTAYTFKVAATNGVGTGAQSDASNAVTPQAAVPGAPTIGTATAGNASATLTWTAPASDGGSAVTGYVVTPYIGATAQPTQTFNSTAVSQTITGLTNGASYTFTVAAINAIGTGPESAASNAVVPAALNVPSPPTIGTALPGNGAITVKWTAPASNGGSAVTGYLVTPYISGVAQPTVVFNSTATTQTLNGLTNGTAYTFSVQAKNVNGNGGASAQSNEVIAGSPGAPGFQAAVPGDGTARVAFTSPPNNGAAITGYQVTPFVGSTPLATQVFNNTATSQIVTGLTNGTTYTFAVQAINSRGAGANAVTAPIVVGTPASPAFPNPVPQGTNSVRISWLAAASNGSSITKYTVIPYIGSTPLAPVVFNNTGTLQVINGLVSGTTYTFRVYATNGRGDGTYSTSPAVTVGSPGPPGYQTAAPGDGTAKVQYAIPANNGSAITQYLVTPVIGSTPQATQVFNTPSATQLTVTGLTNGTAYSFRVQAVNAIGASPNAVTNTVIVGSPVTPPFPSAQPGNASAKVSFSVPANNGSALTGYSVTPYVGSTAQATQNFPATSNAVTLTGLTNGTTYTFKVWATNARGASPVGTTPTAIKVGTPTTPGFPSAQTGNGSAKVSWLASTPNVGSVTGYAVTPVLGTTVLPTQTFNSTATSQTVTGLTNGQTYTFRVAALNSIGTGPYSTTSAVKIGQPAAPTAVTAVTGVGQATVSWTAGADNGSAITGYVVTPFKAGVAQATQTFNSTATTQIVTGLAAGSSYTFKVQAINANGAGIISSASNAVTPT